MIILRRRKEFSVQAGLAAGRADKDNININTPLLLTGSGPPQSLILSNYTNTTQTPPHQGHCDQMKEIRSTDRQQKMCEKYKETLNIEVTLPLAP